MFLFGLHYGGNIAFHSIGIDGRVYVWKISEGPDEEDKPQITGKVLAAIQVVGVEEVSNPRICWHCHKQVLFSFIFLKTIPPIYECLK